MKNIKYILISLLTIVGCDSEFLEEVHPTRETADVFFTKDADAEQAAISLYEKMSHGGIGPYGAQMDGYMSSFDELRGDNLTLPKNFNNNAIVTWLTLNYNAETDAVRDAWRHNYEVIYRANWIIDNVADNENISQDVRNKTLAEAYFMRGNSYFTLTRYFQSVPLVLNATTAETYYPEKASNEESWNQVFSDFQQALDLGGRGNPTPDYMDGRVNTGVIHAMMARAYLYRTRPGSNQYWDKVKEHTLAVENLNVYELEPMEEFSSLFVYTKEDKWVKNSEVIWGAGFIYGPIYGGLPFMYINRSFLGVATMPVGYATTIVRNEAGDPYLIANGRTGRSRFALSPELSDIMIDYYEEGDKRSTEFLYYPSFNNYDLATPGDNTSVELVETVNSDSLYQKIKETGGAEGEYIHLRKFQLKEFIGENIWDGGWNHSLIYPIIRFADVLLMRAEAEFHLGNEGVAREYLKRVTDRAGFEESYVNQFSGPALVDEILQQRRVELVFESQRVPDLIRLGEFNPPNVGTYPGSAPFDEKLMTLPIPRRELDLNKNLVQSEAWR